VKLFDPDGREPDGRDPKYNKYKPIPLLSVGGPGALRLSTQLLLVFWVSIDFSERTKLEIEGN
jgi:hypothetical protein